MLGILIWRKRSAPPRAAERLYRKLAREWVFFTQRPSFFLLARRAGSSSSSSKERWVTFFRRIRRPRNVCQSLSFSKEELRSFVPSTRKGIAGMPTVFVYLFNGRVFLLQECETKTTKEEEEAQEQEESLT